MSSINSTNDTSNLPPLQLQREMRVLDKTLFIREIPLAAARIFNPKDISRLRKVLESSHDLLKMRRVSPISPVPTSDGEGPDNKCLLLRNEIKHDDRTTWTPTIHELHGKNLFDLIPYILKLDYDHFTYSDVMAAVLPSIDGEDIPSSFTQVGHVAHLNLRDEYLPYKYLIARVLRDKASSVTTVINKTVTIPDAANPFRTFPYEVLEGADDLDVIVREQHCAFAFNYGRVYWNPRLGTEHERLVGLFKPGEAVCDVMAGVGPFAVPAAKKGCFVAANDLNPESFAALVDARRRNKAEKFLYDASNDDGAKYIRSATKFIHSSPKLLLPDPNAPKPKISRTQQRAKAATGRKSPSPTRPMLSRPRIFSHYVMNLPASSLTFLPSFIGLYTSLKGPMEADRVKIPLPLIHAYTFAKHTTPSTAVPPGPPVPLPEETIRESICVEVSRHLQTEIRKGDKEMSIHEVRQVAPGKKMYCVSFRLPEEVAWATPLKVYDEKEEEALATNVTSQDQY